MWSIVLTLQMGCNFYFVWYTSATCPTPRFTSCTVEDNGNFYDLSQLSETVSNHVVFYRDDNLKFIINVCHSVVFGTEAVCEYSSGACMLNLNDLNPTTRWVLHIHSSQISEKKVQVWKVKNVRMRERRTLTHSKCWEEHISKHTDLDMWPSGKDSTKLRITQKNRKRKRKLLPKKWRDLWTKGTNKHTEA